MQPVRRFAPQAALSRLRCFSFAKIARCAGPALLLCVATPSGTYAQPASPSTEEVDEGRAIYEDFCATCHGRDMVNPGGVTFDLRKFPKDDAERFRNSVLNGKPPAMPAWRDRVSEEDLKLLWAYVRGGP